MATSFLRKRIQLTDPITLEKLNESLLQLSEWIGRLEGRGGTVDMQASLDITSNKNNLIKLGSAGGIVQTGTDLSNLAFAQGAVKGSAGDDEPYQRADRQAFENLNR